MASKNKLNKAKNSFCSNALKQGEGKLKRMYFYDASQRKKNKKVDVQE